MAPGQVEDALLAAFFKPIAGPATAACQTAQTEFVGANRGHEAGAMGSSAGVQFARDHVARKKPHVPGEDVGQELVLCGVASTLGEVLTSLSRHGVHRIYCTDADERPIGIITCSDVLSKLVAIAMSGNHA
mmetsp:Transcript_8486/g.25694  ORF Transcript_8486/g.25694 Transcript_8486/m.25694 type:complete len:131 (+) Transcript_8486:1365-1757(+)